MRTVNQNIAELAFAVVLFLLAMSLPGCAQTALRWEVREGWQDEKSEASISGDHKSCAKLFGFDNNQYRYCMYGKGYKLVEFQVNQ